MTGVEVVELAGVESLPSLTECVNVDRLDLTPACLIPANTRGFRPDPGQHPGISARSRPGVGGTEQALNGSKGVRYRSGWMPSFPSLESSPVTCMGKWGPVKDALKRKINLFEIYTRWRCLCSWLATSVRIQEDGVPVHICRRATANVKGVRGLVPCLIPKTNLIHGPDE